MKRSRRNIITIVNLVFCLILVVIIISKLKGDNNYGQYLSLVSENFGNVVVEKVEDIKELGQEEILRINLNKDEGNSSQIIFRKEEELKDYVIDMLVDGKDYNKFVLLSARTIDIEDVFNSAMEEVRKIPGYYNMNASFIYSSLGQDSTLEITYITNREKIKEGIKVADRVINEMISDSMTDYEKLLLIHDYLVNNCIYPKEFDEEDSDLYNLYGLLVNGVAVCNGYADAFHYMVNTVGIETIIVNGTGNGIGHAWNMVLLDGEWYQVDVTWDDPVSESGEQVLVYNYFNVTNDEILVAHDYDVSKYPIADSTAFNYFVQNSSYIENEEELMIELDQLFQERGTGLLLKLAYAMNTVELKGLLEGFQLGEYSSLSYDMNEEMHILNIRDIIY